MPQREGSKQRWVSEYLLGLPATGRSAQKREFSSICKQILLQSQGALSRTWAHWEDILSIPGSKARLWPSQGHPKCALWLYHGPQSQLFLLWCSPCLKCGLGAIFLISFMNYLMSFNSVSTSIASKQWPCSVVTLLLWLWASHTWEWWLHPWV